MEESEKHKMYQRSRSWRSRPTKFIVSRFSEDGRNELRKVEILRRVDPGMKRWVSMDDIITELVALAKRNGWIP